MMSCMHMARNIQRRNFHEFLCNVIIILQINGFHIELHYIKADRDFGSVQGGRDCRKEKRMF